MKNLVFLLVLLPFLSGCLSIGSIKELKGEYKLDLDKIGDTSVPEEKLKKVTLEINDDGSVVFRGSNIHKIDLRKDIGRKRLAIFNENFVKKGVEHNEPYIIKVTRRYIILFHAKHAGDKSHWTWFERPRS